MDVLGQLLCLHRVHVDLGAALWVGKSGGHGQESTRGMLTCLVPAHFHHGHLPASCCSNVPSSSQARPRKASSLRNSTCKASSSTAGKEKSARRLWETCWSGSQRWGGPEPLWHQMPFPVGVSGFTSTVNMGSLHSPPFITKHLEVLFALTVSSSSPFKKKFFFLMWAVFKVFIEFVTILLFLF